MFDKFGEFDSADELNQAAAGLLQEGDKENIYVLAKENGIDKEITQMYIEGEISYLADSETAAMGKVDIELAEVKKQYGITAECVAEYVKSLCTKQAFANQVRSKSKSLNGCLQIMQEEAEKQIKVKKGTQCACIPPSEGYKMIRDYYMKGEGKQ